MAFTPLSKSWKVVFFCSIKMIMNVEIQINGKKESVVKCTVADLVAQRDLLADSLIVEYNGKIIKQIVWDEVTLQNGDILELLNFVGGG